MTQAQLFEASKLESPFEQMERALTFFADFPYQRRPFAARNWGHPLHSLCSYPSKIKPSLAHFLIRAFTEPGERVLDPFSGVGTIPFEACNQGRLGIGTDLSPLAAIVTAAKVAPPSLSDLEAVLDHVENVLPLVAKDVDLGTVEPEIRSFFHDDTCREVVAAQQILIHAQSARTPAHLLVVAALCHVLHGNRPYALSRRSHGIIPIPPKGDFVYKPLMESVRNKLFRTRFDDLPPDFVCGEGRIADAFALSLGSDNVDAVITSPPFLGTTEFLRQNRVRLWFCGMTYAQQQEDKPRFVEHRRDLAFYADLLVEWARVLRPGGRLVLHLGVVRKRDMAEEIRPHVEQAGFEVHDILYEPTGHLESQGRTDRGATHTHEFLVATRR